MFLVVTTTVVDQKEGRGPDMSGQRACNSPKHKHAEPRQWWRVSGSDVVREKLQFSDHHALRKNMRQYHRYFATRLQLFLEGDSPSFRAKFNQ